MDTTRVVGADGGIPSLRHGARGLEVELSEYCPTIKDL